MAEASVGLPRAPQPPGTPVLMTPSLRSRGAGWLVLGGAAVPVAGWGSMALRGHPLRLWPLSLFSQALFPPSLLHSRSRESPLK